MMVFDVLRRVLILISRRVAGRDLSSRSLREFCGSAVKGLTLRITIRLGLREVISQMDSCLVQFLRLSRKHDCGHPLPPVGGHPNAGSHRLRKSSLSYFYIFGICKDLQQLW